MGSQLSIGQVFVPGGMPELTYVPRTERHLETNLAEVEDNLCKLVVVTGATKTGKTVLVRKVLDSGRPIVWIDGGVVTSRNEAFAIGAERQTCDGVSVAAQLAEELAGF